MSFTRARRGQAISLLGVVPQLDGRIPYEGDLLGLSEALRSLPTGLLRRDSPRLLDITSEYIFSKSRGGSKLPGALPIALQEIIMRRQVIPISLTKSAFHIRCLGNARHRLRLLDLGSDFIRSITQLLEVPALVAIQPL